MTMKLVGLQIPSFTFPGIPDDQLFEHLSRIAQTAEHAGFDSIFVMDHFYQIGMVGTPTERMLESYTTLAALAARTGRIRLGALVTGVTYRNPALLAKMVTTLDVISSGRAILGIGAAWNEDEHRGYGYDFPTVPERMDRLEEALQICHLMFTEDSPSFEGRYYGIERALNFPRPVQPGGPPILIGGGGERRTLRLVAAYANISNFFGGPDDIRHKIAVLNRHCEEVGRNPGEIVKTRLGGLLIGRTLTEVDKKLESFRLRGMSEDWIRGYFVLGTPEQVAGQVQELLDAGLDGLIFNLPDAYDLETVDLAGRTLQAIGT